MNPLRSLLVIVEPGWPPTEAGARNLPSAALNRAYWIGMEWGASVHLLMVERSPRLLPAYALDAPLLGEIRNARRNALTRELERHARPFADAGIDVQCDVVLDDDGRALDFHIQRILPSCILGSLHAHARFDLFSLRHRDWQLIAASPVPVWLCLPRAYARRPVILACVDPTLDHDKPVDLDAGIINMARCIDDQMFGDLQLLHVFEDPGLPAERAAALAENRSAAFVAFAERHGVSAARCRFTCGQVANSIARTASDLPADLIVLGVAPRSLVGSLAIGHTAARVLEDVCCDVLVVKSGA